MAYHFTRHATNSGLDSYLKTVRTWTELEAMDYHDFAVYDPNAVLAVAEDQITLTSCPQNYAYHMTKDYGAGRFSADSLEGKAFRVCVRSVNSASTLRAAFWGLSNTPSDLISLQNAGEHSVFVLLATTGSAQAISIQETYQGAVNTQYTSLSANTDYWVEIELDKSAGDYGTLRVRVYTDAAYTQRYRTVSAALHADTAFRYLHAATARTVSSAGTYSAVYKDMTYGAIGGGTPKIPSSDTFSIFTRFRAEDVTNNHVIWCIEMDDPDDNRFVLYAAGGIANDPVQFVSSRDGSNTPLSTSTSYSANVWHSVVTCRSALSGRYISLDGGPFEQSVFIAKYPYGNALYMTVSSSGTRRAIAGDVAEIAIWNVDLSLPEYAADVAALAKGISPMTIRPADLVHYWDLTRNLTDRVGGCTLTPFNAPTVSEHPRVIP